MSEMTRDDALAHFGVKGMKWGVRRGEPNPGGASNKTNREAKKDAEEFTKAKMFYGEGAGTRRKLINATVNAKAAKDPTYKAAFDHHVGNTDLAKRASQARSERKRKDVSSTSVKTIKGVHRSLTGGFGSVTLASAALAGGYTYAKQTGADKAVMNAMKSTVSGMRNNRSNMKAAQDILRGMGFK